MSGIWPGDIQCVAMLTFDVDGVSSWLRRDPEYAHLPTLMSMAEYGPKVATWRILDLLDRLDIKGSFNIPGFVAETHPELVKETARRGHEVGHHGYMHETPASMNVEEEEQVLEKGIGTLEGLTGYRPRGGTVPRLGAKRGVSGASSVPRLDLRLQPHGRRCALHSGYRRGQSGRDPHQLGAG